MIFIELRFLLLKLNGKQIYHEVDLFLSKFDVSRLETGLQYAVGGLSHAFDGLSLIPQDLEELDEQLFVVLISIKGELVKDLCLR